MIFYLGTHHDAWVGRVDLPLFLSRRRLAQRKTLRPALNRWAIDSGGFTELNMYGEWHTSPSQYAEELDRFDAEIGMIDWAAPQDWMCEPPVRKMTGLSVRQHQKHTIQSVHDLRDKTDVHVIPVLQGWKSDDYFNHVEQYRAAGIDLLTEPVVGLGSVCRRQHTSEIHELVTELSDAGLKLHGFGMKLKALPHISNRLVSADSLSWSYTARRSPPLPGHETRHINCANCLEYALLWREKVMKAIAS